MRWAAVIVCTQCGVHEIQTIQEVLQRRMNDQHGGSFRSQAALIWCRNKEANEKRGQTARNLFSSGSARKGAGRYGPSGSTMRPLRSSANFDIFNDRRLPCHCSSEAFGCNSDRDNGLFSHPNGKMASCSRAESIPEWARRPQSNVAALRTRAD